jgi:hypothetical protein
VINIVNNGRPGLSFAEKPAFAQKLARMRQSWVPPFLAGAMAGAILWLPDAYAIL